MVNLVNGVLFNFLIQLVKLDHLYLFYLLKLLDFRNDLKVNLVKLL